MSRTQATGSAGSSSGGSPSLAILSIRDVARQIQLDPSNPRWAKGTVGLEEDPMDRTALEDLGHAIIASVTARQMHIDAYYGPGTDEETKRRYVNSVTYNTRPLSPVNFLLSHPTFYSTVAGLENPNDRRWSERHEANLTFDERVCSWRDALAKSNLDYLPYLLASHPQSCSLHNMD